MEGDHDQGQEAERQGQVQDDFDTTAPHFPLLVGCINDAYCI
jgi:hypothetical protein